MKRKIIAIAIVGVFAAAGMTGVLANARPGNGHGHGNAGPAEKATGNVTVLNPINAYITADFNAHEAKGNRDAKGCFEWWLYDDVGNVERYFKVDINDVTVEGSEAWFAGEIVVDTGDMWLGETLHVYAMDGGSPGVDNDLIGWTVYGGYDHAQGNAEDYITEIVSGNLVVHTY